jgi:uncharacterized protein (TIGR02246 family)
MERIMKSWIWLGLAFSLLPALAFAQTSELQLVQVKAAFEQYDHGWRANDAQQILGVMATDIDWTNDSGLRLVGKDKVEPFLKKLFKQPNFLAGKPGPLIYNSVRLLSSDVAVVVSTEDTFNQKVWNTGKTVPVLHSHELTVLQRRGGHWLIVSDLVSDESHGI